MQGLCGIVSLEAEELSDTVLGPMIAAAPHRASCGSAVVQSAGFAGAVLFGNAAAWREAATYQDGTGSLVLWHGRLDNRGELQEELGISRDRGDAEVVMQAFRLLGLAFAPRLIGDFAFVVWESRSGTIVAGRDPFGMRPLYIHAGGTALGFASEIKQLLAIEGVEARLSEERIAMHLAGVSHPVDQTAYEGIFHLSPGHLLTWSSGEPTTRAFWDFPIPPRLRYRSEDQYAERLRTLFRRAVEDRLDRYDRIGIFLSGGTDSVATASMAAAVLRDRGTDPATRLHAYCFDYSAFPRADEREISRMVTHHFGIPVTEIPVHDYMPLSDWPATTPDADDPHMGAYQQLLEAGLQRAKDDGMVAMLGGDRGDLLFGEFIYDYWPLVLRGELRRLWNELGRHARWRSTKRWYIARRYLISPLREQLLPLRRMPSLRAKIRALRMKAGRISSPLPNWLPREFTERTGLLNKIFDDASPSASAMPRALRRLAIMSPMQMRGATWSERTCARFGLAHIDAWSDLRLAEFALSVPQDVLNRVGEDKRLVRIAMQGVVPENARLAMRKIYPIDVYRHALETSGVALIRELLDDMKAAEKGYIDVDALRDHHAQIVSGGADQAAFWNAITLEMWLRSTLNSRSDAP